MTTDDTQAYPHIVVIETATNIRMVEFERDAYPTPGIAAHLYAERATGEPGTRRVVVAMRERAIERFTP